jgi:hypothetical protein
VNRDAIGRGVHSAARDSPRARVHVANGRCRPRRASRDAEKRSARFDSSTPGRRPSKLRGSRIELAALGRAFHWAVLEPSPTGPERSGDGR